MTGTDMTPADFAACTGNNNNGAFGGNDIYSLIILFIFASMFGFGGCGGFGGMGGGGIWPWLLLGGGFGGYGGNNCGIQEAIASGFNNSAVLASLNDIKMGQAQAINYNNQGFNGLNTALLQGFNGVERGFCDISHQLSDCCCENRAAIADLKYATSKEACDTRYAMYNNTRDIVDNQNSNARAILDALTAQRIADKDERIAEQNQKIFALELAASQANQNNVLRAAIDASTAEILRRTGHDCPTAAYLVQPPTAVNFPTNGCGTVQFGASGCCGNGYGNF